MADIVDLTPHLIGTPANGVNLYQVPNASMEVLEDVINATWNLGLAKADAATAKATAMTANDGLLDVDLAPTAAAGAAVTAPAITAPSITIADAAVADVFNTFTSEYIELATWLTTQFTTFISTYAPNEQALYASGEASLAAALASNVFIPASIASQILTDDRDRINADAGRAQADVLDVFASKRFPLPPGASAAAVIEIQKKAQDEIAESSRKIAIMSVEQYRFVIQQVFADREAMLKSAVDYVKALASGPDMVSRMVNIGYDAQQKMISAAAAFYSADANAKEIIAKVAQFNSGMTFDANKANQESKLSVIGENVKTMVADLSLVAQEAIAALNNLQIHVSMQAGGTTVTTQAQEV